MFQELPELPGLKSSALLGDLLLLSGQRQRAAEVYLDAWTRAEPAALEGYLALEGERAPIDALERLAFSLRDAVSDGALSPARAEPAARALVALLLLTRRDANAGAAAATRLLGVMPEARLLWLQRPGALNDADWRDTAALAAQWREQDATTDREDEVALRVAWLEATANLPPSPAGRAPMARRGPRLYRALRDLDLATPFWRPQEEEPGLNLLSSLLFLTQEVQDRRERSVWGCRLGDRLWAGGATEEARAVYEALGGASTTPLEALSRDRLQRIHVATGRWDEAAALAEQRAARCDDPALREALWLLWLDYLQRARAAPARRREAAAHLLDLDARGQPLSAPTRRLAFEICEGALLELRADEDLLAFWRRHGALPDDSAPPGERRPRGPDRALECYLMNGERLLSPTALAEDHQLRRLAVVRALANARPRVALQLLRAAPALRDEDRLLRAALWVHLGRQGELSAADEARAESARQELEGLAGMSALGAGRDLLSLYVLRELLRERGELDKARVVFTQVWSAWPPGVQASLQALLGRDMLDGGRASEALGLARRAFALAPGEPRVRALLRDAAQATGDERALALLDELVDDDALERLLTLPDQQQRLQQALAAQDRAPRDAANLLVAMAEEAPAGPVRAALLRRAGELARDRVGDPRLASALLMRAVEAHHSDRLASRAALELLLQQDRLEEAANLLEAVAWRDPLPPELARRLLSAGLTLHEQGRDAFARPLLRRGALSTPQGVELPLLRRALTTLAPLEIRSGLTAPLADLLEELLQRETDPEQRAWLHAQLAPLRDDPADASHHWRRALLAEHTRAHALQALEDLYARSGRWADLVRLLREDSDREHQNPNNRATFLEALAHILAEHMADPLQARQLLDEVLRLHPRHLPALLQAAALDLHMERYEEGVASLEAAARLVEDQGERSALYAEIGGVYERLANPTLALEAYMVSFICDNKNLQTFERLEALYSRAGRWNELIGIYEVAIEAARLSDAPSGYTLEDLYARRAHIEFHHMEREEAAARSFLEALRANPANPRYAELITGILPPERAPELAAEVYALRAQALSPASPERIDALRRQATSLRRLNHRQRDAADLFRQILALDPQDHDAASHLEALYKEQERWEDLAALYQERMTLAQRPEDALALARSIAQLAERKLRDFDLAIATWDQILRDDPKNLFVIRSLGRLYEATRRWDDLIEVTRREVALTEGGEQKAHLLFKLGSVYETARHQDQEAIACYRAALEQDPRCVPALHGLRELHRAAGRWEEVLGTLQQEAALWDKPRERAGVLAMMGQICLEHLRDPARAEPLLREALSLQEQMPRALALLLDLLLAQARWDEAAPLVEALLQSAQAQPARQRAQLHVKAALVARHQRLHGPAREALRRALSLAPTDEDALRELVAAAEAGAQTDPEEAAFLSSLRERLDREGSPTARALLATHRAITAQRHLLLEDALEALREAVDLHPDGLEETARLASLLHRLRRFDAEAAAWAALVAACRGERPQTELHAQRTLALLCRDWLHDLARAMGHLRRAQALAPDDLDLCFEEAQALWLMRRFEEARALLQQILDDPRATDDAQRAQWRFYQGRVLELGLRQDDLALDQYQQALRGSPNGPCALPAALATAQLLLRLERLDDLRRWLDDLMEATTNREIANHGELQLLRAHALMAAELPSNPDAIVSVSEDLPDAPEVQLNFDDLITIPPDAAPSQDQALWRRLHQEPWDPATLRALAEDARRNHQAPLRRRLHALLTALGQATRQEQQPPDALAAALDLDALAAAAHLDPLRSPEAAGLGAMQGLLARSFPSSASTLQPDELDRAVHIDALLASVNSALRITDHSQGEVVPLRMGPEGTALRFTNQKLAGRGALPLAVVSVSLDFEALARGGESLDAAARFLLGRATEHVRVGLAACRAMSLLDLGHCVEILSRCQHGASLNDVQDIEHLRPAARKLRAYGLPRSLPGFLQQMDACGRDAPVTDPADARRRATALLDALELSADRAALALCGDLGAAIDALTALETGQDLRTLNGDDRADALRRLPRARALALFYLSPAWPLARDKA